MHKNHFIIPPFSIGSPFMDGFQNLYFLNPFSVTYMMSLRSVTCLRYCPCCRFLKFCDIARLLQYQKNIRGVDPAFDTDTV